MAVFLVTRYVKQKDGSTRREQLYHLAEESPADNAVEVPRLPAYGERWDATAGAFVVDEEMVAKAATEAELRGLTLDERHRRTMRAVRMAIYADLQSVGVVTAAQVATLAKRAGDA